MIATLNQDKRETTQKKPSQDVALISLLVSALGPYKSPMIIACILMILTAVINAVPPYLLQQAIDGPIARGDLAGLWPYVIWYGVTAAGFFVLTYGFKYYVQLAGQQAIADLRVRLFSKIFKQDQAFYHKHPVGDLVARLTSDIDTLNGLLSSSVVIILIEGVTLIVIVGVMFVVNWRLALISLAILPFLTLVTIYFRKRIRESSGDERSAMADISSFLNEQINGMTIVQLFRRQAKSEQEFDGYNSSYRRAIIDLRWHSALFLAVLEVFVALGSAFILYGGGQGVLAGWATLGTLVAFIQYTQRAYQPILNLSQQYNAVQIALGAAERLYEMLKTEPEVKSAATPIYSTQDLEHIRGEIEFQDVHFRYLPDEPVLRGVSLKIEPGQTVAVVGATGAGKSSLVSLIARFYDPQAGQILLDGMNLKDIDLNALRHAVVVVPQDPVCLAGTVAHNIRLYRDDISDEAVRRAAELSNAARFIDRLAEGYEHVIESGGANISQGQRQLLSLARALALSPDGVLVLDEATSSIDTETEALIQEALERILRTRTSLVIAHRLSTIRNADRIIVMDKGKIVEDGPHAALMAQDGYYAKLHQYSPQAWG